MQYNIEFFGYTWDDYLHVISDKSGILIGYNGSLDQEGTIKLKEILLVDYSTNFGELIDSEKFSRIRESEGKHILLFYSYTPVSELEGKIIRPVLIQNLKPKYDAIQPLVPDVVLRCTGACALFPSHLLDK